MSEIRVYDYGNVLIISTKKENVLLGVIDALGLFSKMADDITPEQRNEIENIMKERKEQLK